MPSLSPGDCLAPIAPVAALVGSDHVIAGRGQRQHHLAPARGEFREPVQQHDSGTAGLLETGLQHMNRHAVDVGFATPARMTHSGRSRYLCSHRVNSRNLYKIALDGGAIENFRAGRAYRRREEYP
jgi:hypothetical protein